MSVLLSCCKRYDRFPADFPHEGYRAMPERRNSQNSDLPVCFGELAMTVSEPMLRLSVCTARVSAFARVLPMLAV